MLDASNGRLYDDVFARIVTPKETVKLRCDFHTLTRGLLKVSYNSARAHEKKEDVAALSRSRPYILGRTPAPDRIGLFLQLVVPHALSPAEQQQLDPLELQDLPQGPDGLPEIPPTIMRVAPGIVRDGRLSNVLCRLVAINSFNFYLVIPRGAKIQVKTWFKAIRTFGDLLSGLHKLDPDNDEVTAAASRVDIVQSYGATALKNASPLGAWRKAWLASRQAEHENSTKQ